MTNDTRTDLIRKGLINPPPHPNVLRNGKPVAKQLTARELEARGFVIAAREQLHRTDIWFGLDGYR